MADLPKLRLYWTYGEKTVLAKRCGMTAQVLSDYLTARKLCTPEVAELLEKEANAMGVYLTRLDLLFPHQSRSPLLTLARPLGID